MPWSYHLPRRPPYSPQARSCHKAHERRTGCHGAGESLIFYSVFYDWIVVLFFFFLIFIGYLQFEEYTMKMLTSIGVSGM